MSPSPGAPSTSPRPPKRRRTGRGQKPMIGLAGAALLGLALLNEHRIEGKHGALWPVLVAILAFLYLWWLSSLIFDLVFVWHRYIQGDAAHRFLRSHVRRANLNPEADPPPPEPMGGAPAMIPPGHPPPPAPSGTVPAQAPTRYPLPPGDFKFDERNEENSTPA